MVEISEFSHRNSRCRFVKIDAKRRDSKAKAILTCEKDDMPKIVKKYQDLGYEIVNIKEM